MKAAAALRAIRVFTDRDDARALFDGKAEHHRQHIAALSVLVFYGVGSVGKTALLNQLADQLVKSDSAENRFTTVTLNLEGPELTSPPDALFAIRQQLPIPASLFEYALVRFWSLAGRSLEDIKRSRLREDSLLLDLVETAGDLAGAIAPARLLKRLWDRGGAAYEKRLGRSRHDFEEIDALSNEELLVRLPGYLGVAIDDAVRLQSCRLVVFVDTHDAIVDRPGFRTTKCVGDEWLRDLIGTAEQGLWVLAGRERIRWADVNPEWAIPLEQHMLIGLGVEDSERYLEQVGVSEPTVRSSIVNSSHGNPLFLSLCASTYLRRKADGEVIREADFRIAEREVIERFVSHLEPHHAGALEICAALERFDRQLFLAITRALNLPFSAILFRDFIEFSYADVVSASDQIYKIHDSVRAYLGDELELEVARMLFDAVLQHCIETLGVPGIRRTAWVFDQLFVLLSRYALRPNVTQIEDIVAIGLDLVDSGLWASASTSFSRVAAALRPAVPELEAAAALVRGVCARKFGRLAEAASLLAQVNPADIGRHRDHLLFFRAHVDHLLGNYDRALAVYEALTTLPRMAHGPNTLLPPASLLAQRQRADVFILQGRFREAEHAFKSLPRDAMNPLWDAEQARFVGHIFRWNFHLGLAEQSYLAAAKSASSVGGDAMHGKALTNLAETLAWSSPTKAIEYAHKALDIHKDTGNLLEVGKTLVANAVALAIDGSLVADAFRMLTEAEKLQERTGYQAGALFALQAKALLQERSGDRRSATDTLARVIRFAADLGVYEYCCLPLLVLLRPTEIAAISGRFDWLDFEFTLNTVRGAVRHLTPAPRDR
ncbi:MAG: hypothetical protein HY899_05275 [Deltaproteobacteria bacterium]|nr:hypothetical protein [Deltaproteobacteria bacterium]